MNNFPNAPIVGQIFDKWTWDGLTWRLSGVSKSGSGFTFVQDAVPTATKSGDTWFRTDTTDSFVWIDDGSSTQWVQFAPGRKYLASQIAFTPTTTIAATNVQAAIDEVATDTAATYARGVEVIAPYLVLSGTAVSANVLTTVSNTISFTPRVGRRYRLFFRIRAITGSPGYVYLRTAGSNNIATNDIYNYIGGAYIHHDIEVIFDGNDVASTYWITYFSSVATTIYSGDQPVGRFYIEDVGPAR